MRMLLIVVGLLAVIGSANPSLSQSRARLWDIKFGSPVGALPTDQWVEPACGTNGGPPSIRLGSFADFARCRVEEGTGLREVWFIYDDEWEYIARAYRDPVEVMMYAANVFYGQPITTSLLIDDMGTVQGYRVVTDPRAPNLIRREAFGLHAIFKTLFSNAPWQCTNQPLAEREALVDGEFVKSVCVMASDRLFVRSEGRLLRKPGQEHRDVAGMSERAEGDFESWARLDVLAAAAVKDAPCCRSAPAN